MCKYIHISQFDKIRHFKYMPVKKPRYIIFYTFLYGQGIFKKETRQPELSNIKWQTVLECQRLYIFPESFDHIQGQ